MLSIAGDTGDWRTAWLPGARPVLKRVNETCRGIKGSPTTDRNLAAGQGGDVPSRCLREDRTRQKMVHLGEF